MQWEGLQNGASSTYNGLNQLPKPYIVIGGEKVYLAVDSLTRGGVATNSAILAGSYVATVNAKTTGDYTYAQATITFTISPYELKTIYLTQNVFIYSGNNNVIEVYALGVNNDKVVISNRTITKNGTAATNCIDAGSYVVTVSSGALDDNYTIANTVNSVSFVVNPMSVTVNFGNLASWVFTDGNNPAITITASVANAVEVKYGKFGTVNTPVADNGSGSFTIAANSMSSLIGQKGMISVTAKNGNYQISGQSFQTFEVVSSVSAATVDFKLDSNSWTDDNKTFTYGDNAAIAVSGSNGGEIKYYKDGVLLTNPITNVSSLDAGTYLITASHASLNLTSNVSGTSRSFKVNPKAVDLSSANWVIDGNAVASNSVAYNGQIYNATLNLGSHASDFDVYYTNGANKNIGSVTTKATVVPKSGNYVATNVSDTYSWNITEATATVA
ncbi:MAG: hypothetical protein K2N74_05410, partial [Clostridiales bacterium]|nr:hypothetical protein [Clostridiales bacterium]